MTSEAVIAALRLRLLSLLGSVLTHTLTLALPHVLPLAPPDHDEHALALAVSDD